MTTFTVDSKAGYRSQIQADTIEQAARQFIEMVNGVGRCHFVFSYNDQVVTVKHGRRIVARIYAA